jgi:hypothetical protein
MSFLLDLFCHLVAFAVTVILTVIMMAVVGLPFIINGILTNYDITLCWQVWAFASLAWWMALIAILLPIINSKN